MECLPTGLKTILTEPSGLKVEIFYLECLAQASYLISHEGKAFMVDPRRDVEPFFEVLKSEDLSLCGVLETHFHADFVSGHYEIGKRAGVPIYFGPGAMERCKFPVHELKDNEVIEFSSQYSIHALSTPGHTMESVVYLVVDKSQNNRPLKAFTGDTLFIGSCGRPDLVGSIGFTAEDMSRHMYRTMRDKISTLPDDVQIFPAHGAGSPCGKNISKDLYSTIGKEKATNPALRYTDEEEFVKFLVANQPTSPKYFSYNVQLNTEGAPMLAEDLSSIPKLCTSEFTKNMFNDDSCVIIDTRNAVEFCKGHIPGSMNFPLGAAGGAIVGHEDGNFAIWIGTCLSNKTDLLLVNAPGKDSEALQRLARIGYTNVRGVLCGGIDAYVQGDHAVTRNSRINLFCGPSLADYISQGYQLLDVRTKGEFEGNTVKGAINIPLAQLDSLTGLLNKDQKYIAFCAGGFRSTIAASILKARGFKVQDVDKGFAAISVTSPLVTTTGKVCPILKAAIEETKETAQQRQNGH